MTRKLLLLGVAVGCLLSANSALAGAAADRPVRQFYGSIDPFYGSIDPFYGSIDPFYGAINPFYGSINPFYGTISPFWGEINPFWGNINPFYGSIDPFYGNIDPFWGNINPFYGSINPFWGTIQPFWQSAGPQWGAINTTWKQLQASNATDYSGLQVQLQGFIGQAATFWGPKVQQYTNKNFADGFATAMLAKYNINPNDAASLANVSDRTRFAFFLNWYDGLMNFTGVDHVDWWMGAVHWRPQLTQIQNLGQDSVIGVLDAGFTSNNSGVANLSFIGGYQMYVNDHGAAVASLIAAKHDGKAIMGISPNSQVDVYNPFDQTGTASWTDVAQGISRLYRQGAFVVNASLGLPGWVLSSEWSNMLTGSLLSGRNHDLVLVKAAGNEGVTQTADVAWAGNGVPNNLILVGSTDPNNNISSFSNTPGEACILVNGVCKEENKLKYRFVVAPGELILVSDNNGGVTRMSGTSFAAPLVTGAVALLQDRWPWLQTHADETTQIIFRSARDLGAPGVDPVYGWGMLDVEASQSPLNFNNLVVYKPYTYNNGQNISTVLSLLNGWSPTALKAAVLNPGQLNLWQRQNAFIVAFENIGTTYRDFTIPLSSMLVGKNQKVNGNENPFQSYLYRRLIDWAGSANATSFASRAVQLSEGEWSLSMVATASSPDEVRSGDGPFHSEFVAANAATGVKLRVGEGNGAYALAGGGAFSLRSDFDPSTGGVNPVLGFASGGAYAGAGIALGDKARLSLGFTQKSDGHTYMDPSFGPLQSMPLAPSKASASMIALDYAVADGVTLNSSYTRLDEATGLLGAQGGGALALPGGQTEAAALGATANFAGGWNVSGSATVARTTAAGPQQAVLTLAQGALQSTAYELVAAKTGLFGETDQLRIAFTQPLHVEGGALEYRSLQVIDRKTGELGPVAQTWNVSGRREYRMEGIYKMMVLDGRAEVDGFALLHLNGPETNGKSAAMSVGAQFKLDL